MLGPESKEAMSAYLFMALIASLCTKAIALKFITYFHYVNFCLFSSPSLSFPLYFPFFLFFLFFYSTPLNTSFQKNFYN